MWLIPNKFATLTAYPAGAVIEFNGVSYEALSAIPATNTTSPVQDNGASWKIDSVVRIQDAYSAWAAVYLALNSNQTKVTNSIWLFLQESEQTLNKVLRSPAMKMTRSFTLDANSSFVLPENLLDIDNLRLSGSVGSTNTESSLQQQGFIEITGGNKAEYELLRQRYAGGIVRDIQTEFDFPVYWIDEDVAYIAPAYSAGTVVELTFYGAEASLGTTQLLVNADFEPINADAQTLADWVADGNDESTFVQDEAFIDTNLWISQTPHLLKLGALVAAEHYLNNDPRSAAWREEFIRNQAETVNEYEAYEANRPHTMTLKSTYSQ